ncbi:CDGSH iron-sulfur domain-containing protein 3, mitochondrial [Galendromus occidentalis]|uniref:CDGSH iron-sulfur domain-containing protein 3, mitochondrial n=1 Tax=Galendromus occidentalis TaxID=34638 RepID=A0AAJ6QSN1_9ACAR|nr:CDGSH iron-sulfur domain-containing protein 3, mitochondrial [Galendromus occidentalis]
MSSAGKLWKTAGLIFRQQSTQASQTPQPVIKGKIAKKIPAFVMLKPGKQYHWCACGLSKKQPFCDGAHKSMPEPMIKPIAFEVPTEKKYLLCRCKQTNNRPFCDLSHVKTFVPEGLRSMLGIKL